MASQKLTDYQRKISDQLIEKIREGTAPWQRSWRDGASMPMNPTTGKAYRGANALVLMMQPHEDPRWMTYKQAQSVGAQVKKGEKSTEIVYWKFEEERVKKDKNGKPVLDENGEKMTEKIKFAVPRSFSAHVFNATQIEGLEAYKKPELEWNPIEKAESLLEQSGAKIKHTDQNRAIYNAISDTVTLPHKEQFPEAGGYYATALHELGHWTGHASRLNRDMMNPFGSEAYAREELRAEIASMMTCDKVGIPHEKLDNHAAYIEGWVKALQDDPSEIFRAAADADKIADYIIALEQTQKQTVTQSVEQTAMQSTQQAVQPITTVQAVESSVDKALAISDSKREYLNVPYKEKNQAKKLGAKWDAVAKSWYVGQNADREGLSKWMTKQDGTRTFENIDPQKAFAEVLQSVGAKLEKEHPIMDGKSHRIAAEDDKQGQKSIFYVGHLDSIPAGYVKNNRTGEEKRWKNATTSLPSVNDKESIQKQYAIKRQAVAEELQKQHEKAAERINDLMTKLPKLEEPTAYHKAKGIEVHDGTFLGKDGTLCVPMQDVSGNVQSMQYINEDGSKFYAKESKKEGCFHVVGGDAESLEKANAIVISEGYATAATIKESLHCAAVAAFDSGNVQKVAKMLQEQYPDKAFVIAGDDDKTVKNNPGRTNAEAAAKAIGGQAVFPTFAPNEKGKQFTDFNDLRKSSLGKEAVQRQIAPVIKKAIEQKALCLHRPLAQTQKLTETQSKTHRLSR